MHFIKKSSLADDVARVRQVLARQDGPTVLAAHSYGGQVITSLGTDAPNVVGLVYIAGFGLDEGESIGALLQQGPTSAGGRSAIEALVGGACSSAHTLTCSTDAADELARGGCRRGRDRGDDARAAP